mmetsp:Transcript_16024/g.24936  ORF Transcript_16024/g.24936 Transcript_16024/m.24936 type:complete len:286 (-) Transcript_16024:197-1054(-)
MSSSNIVKSGSQTVGSGGSLFGIGAKKPHYQYEYYHDSSVKGSASVVILFVVGTAVSCTAYSDLAANCVSGQSTVWVTVDNNPGNIVKLSAEDTSEAFNDIVANITERLGDTASSTATILIGGHSAGGFSAIAAMQENGGDLSFKPAGFIAADPLGRGAGVPALKIECPTFAMGFTIKTCAVTLDQAGLAAYNITSNSNRVMMQMRNLRSGFGKEITHCIFASDGCPGCAANEAGAWTRSVMGKFCILFVGSIQGENTTRAQYVEATGENSDLVNVFYGNETATV